MGIVLAFLYPEKNLCNKNKYTMPFETKQVDVHVKNWTQEKNLI
jgi:hypothetical protein